MGFGGLLLIGIIKLVVEGIGACIDCRRKKKKERQEERSNMQGQGNAHTVYTV